MSDWGQHGSATAHARYPERIESGDPGWRRLCTCGCRKRQSHRGMANGVCLMSGCELRVRRWVRDGVAAHEAIPPEPPPPLHEEPTCEHAEDLDAIYEEPVFRGDVLVGVRATCMRCKP